MSKSISVDSETAFASFTPDERATAGVFTCKSRSLAFSPAFGAFIAVAFILPNLIGWLPITAISHFVPGWFNLEFAALAILYAWRPSRVLLVVLACEVVLDLFEPVALMYYFSPADAFDALQYLGLVPRLHLLLYALYVVIYLALLLSAVWVCRRRYESNLRSAVCVSSLLVCTGSVYHVDQIRRMRSTDVTANWVTPQNWKLARTPAITLIRRIIPGQQPGGSDEDLKLDSAMAAAWRLDGNMIVQTRPNVALILVESWGEMYDPESRDFLTAAYSSSSLRSRYELSAGLVPFHGPTIGGESRELCGKIFAHGIASASGKELADCVPEVMRKRGYDTLGIHGFAPRMYGRLHWYPKAGFSRFLFAPELAALGLHTCPAGLTGTCDTEVAEVLRTKLKAATDRPLFVHWVSINSHLPVTVTAASLAGAKCSANPLPLQEAALCLWAAKVGQVHRSVVSIAEDHDLAPTVFVIVGDHAPPFTSARRRALVSQSHVPYLILTPKILLGKSDKVQQISLSPRGISPVGR